MIRFLTTFLIALALAGNANAALDPAKLKPLPVPGDGLHLAARHIVTVPQTFRPFMRYVWVGEFSQENFQTTLLALAYLSRASTLTPPKEYLVLGKQVIVVDLRRQVLANQKDLEAFAATWEELQYDPAFSTLITKDMLKTLKFPDGPPTVKARVKEWKVVPSKPYVASDGKTYESTWVATTVVKSAKITDLKDFDVIRLDGRHIDQAAMAVLQFETASLAPIVDFRYLIARGLATIKDKGLYAEVFGGLYYDFAGIPTDPNRKKGTDEDALYESLGLGLIDAGFTVEKLFDQLQSDQRAAMSRSLVTSGPRRIDWFQAPAGRETIGMVFVTHDVRRQDIDIGNSPIANLDKFKDAAREIIFVKTNGMHGGALYDANGKRQDVVPPDIASDHAIPAPHHKDLQAMIGCIRCHNVPKEAQGVQPFVNEIKILLAEHLKVVAELGDIDKVIPETLLRLKGRYAGDPSVMIQRVRDDLSRATLQAIGPWKDGGDQTQIVALSGKHLVGVWEGYMWGQIDARVALRELGFDVPKELAVATLKAMLPPDPQSQIGDVFIEDFRIGYLKAGLSINRSDWALVYSFAAERAQRTMAAARAIAAAKKTTKKGAKK